MAVYLDHNATTPLDPRVWRIIQPYFMEKFGNASSRDHAFGWDASEAVQYARMQVAESVDVPVHGVFFVSSATEALSTVIRAYVGFEGWRTKKIITCSTEHDAVLTSCRHLSARTCIQVVVLPVDAIGRLDPRALEAEVAQNSGSLVVVMMANNEIGTLHPITEICAIAHAAGALVLSDTTQAAGRVPLELSSAGVDFATLSAHKMYGPKGSGALLVCSDRGRGVLEPLILGGGQEHGLRGGTLNVPAIVGLGAAAALLETVISAETITTARLRDRLEAGVLSQIADAWINGDRAYRLCNSSSIGFKEIDARVLIRDMHDIAVSTKSACSSDDPGPSHVLKAIGLTNDEAYSCIRFSLGRFTTEEEIDYTINKVVTSTYKLRRNKSVRV